MKASLILIGAIFLLGAVYVVPAVVIETWHRFRGRKTVQCPATGRAAIVELDAYRAAMTSAVGRPRLRLEDCSRWPEHIDCGRECLEELRS